MLVWVIALHCEAKPVIDHYRLKKSTSHRSFDVYSKENMHCIICGIGKTSAAAATAWAAGLNHNNGSIAWINIGTAGSARHDIGTALTVYKITDNESNRHFYPVPLFESCLETTHCQTLSQPSTDYHPQQIFDMEASAFFDTATRFSSAELVHCLKIISDNPAHQTGLNKARISELIHQHIVELSNYAQSLQNLNERVTRLEIDHSDWKKFLACAHFTQTQRTRVHKSLGFLLNRQYQTDALITEMKNIQSADSIIDHLENLCRQKTQDL
jgi:adenosylhomocysteine nucleosidase